MLIIAGHLTVAAEQREDYLRSVRATTELARRAPGCLAFVQAPDPVEADRVVIFERWESEEDLLAFRDADLGDGPGSHSHSDSEAAPDLPAVLGAEVLRYGVSDVGAP